MIDPTQTIQGIENTFQPDYSANSFSSYLMREVTVIRNETLIGKIFATPTYLVICLISLVETSVALFFANLSILISPIFPSLAARTIEWLKSSAFCVLWSAMDSSFNLLSDVLFADEPTARTLNMIPSVTMNGVYVFPQGALVYRKDLK